jgi:hypothetical protein
MIHKHSPHPFGPAGPKRRTGSKGRAGLAGAASCVTAIALLWGVWAQLAFAHRNPYAATVHLRAEPFREGEYGGYGLRISFKAPVAVANAKSAYGLELYLPKLAACGYGGNQGKSIEGDVRRGQTVRVFYRVFLYKGCFGVIHGEVIYGRQPDAITGPNTTFGGHVVGRFSFRASDVGAGSAPASHLGP